MALGRVFSSLAISVIVLAAEPPQQCNGACAEGDEVQFLHIKENGKDNKNSADSVVFKVSPVNGEKNSLLSKGVKTSVVLGGGGNPQAAREVGYLRALNQMGLLDGIDQMVETAGLVTAPLLYAKGLTLDELLGPPTEPANLTLSSVATASGSKILEVMTYPIGWSIAHTVFASAPSFGGPVSNADFFESVIALNYLCPFGLNGKLPAPGFSALGENFLATAAGVLGADKVPPLPADCSQHLSNKNQVWALDEAHLQRMASQNPTLDMEGNLTIQEISTLCRSLRRTSGSALTSAEFPSSPGTRSSRASTTSHSTRVRLLERTSFWAAAWWTPLPACPPSPQHRARSSRARQKRPTATSRRATQGMRRSSHCRMQLA
ncbi:unnamed protein product [Symbiodinium sp. CCMP2456]|nr:unnamed protein product [Symbiodinium sp. CCMP2456]